MKIFRYKFCLFRCSALELRFRMITNISYFDCIYIIIIIIIKFSQIDYIENDKFEKICYVNKKSL